LRRKSLLAIGAATVVSLAVAAANKAQPLNVKLGLWQMTYTNDGSGAPTPAIPPELRAKMLPEQRAKTEARLKARAAQSPHIDTRRTCLTEEKLNKAAFDSEDDKSCQRTIIASTPKLLQFHEECLEGGQKRTADGRFETLESEMVKGSLKVNITGNNAALTTVTDIAGKWIGTDCLDAK